MVVFVGDRNVRVLIVVVTSQPVAEIRKVVTLRPLVIYRERDSRNSCKQTNLPRSGGRSGPRIKKRAACKDSLGRLGITWHNC